MDSLIFFYCWFLYDELSPEWTTAVSGTNSPYNKHSEVIPWGCWAWLKSFCNQKSPPMYELWV